MPKHAPDVDKRGSESFHRPGKIRIPHLNRMVSIKDPSPLSPKPTNENPLADCCKNPNLRKQISKQCSLGEKKDNGCQSGGNKKRGPAEENVENSVPKKKVPKTSPIKSSKDETNTSVK
ncbi:uncharacterized protein LOC111137671 isoform X2 [Crassostrea virginica]